MFTSCKDTDEDWKNQVIVGQVSLEDQIKGLQDAIDNIKSCECNIDAVKAAILAELNRRMDALEALMAAKADALKAGVDANTAAIDRIDSDIQTLQGQITTLNTTLSSIEGKFDALNTLIGTINTSLGTISSSIDKLTGKQEEIRALLEGYRTMMEYQFASLNNTVALIMSQLDTMNGHLGSIDDHLGSIDGHLGDIDGSISDLNDQLDAINVTIGGITTSLGDLYDQIGNVKDAIAGVNSELTGIKGNLTQLNNTLTQTNQKLEAIETKLDGVVYNLWALTQQVQENGATLTALLETYNDLKDHIDAVDGRVDDLEAYKNETIVPAIEDLQKLMETVYDEENGLVAQVADLVSKVATNAENIGKNTEAIELINEDIENLYEYVRGHDAQISQLNARVNFYFSALNDRLNSLITSMHLNQTWNPMFGSINLPVGLSTTIAANYYGYNDRGKTIKFPLSSSTEYNGNEGALGVLNEVDPDALNITPKVSEFFEDKATLEIGENTYYMSSADNNLGQFYVTINPNNINFEGGNLQLVNSKDEVTLVDLDVKKCNDEELTFGVNISRAADNNGFYRVNAKVDADKAPTIGIRVEEGLKTAMKDALKDRTKQDFVELAKLVYRQMDGILPAYALKASWTAPVVVKEEVPGADGETQVVEKTVDQEFAVYSKYEIAATAFRPLGYSFLKDVDLTDHKIKLPTYEGSVKEILDKFFDDFNFNFDLGLTGVGDVDFKDFNINLEDVNLDFGQMEIKIDLNGTTLHTTQWNEYSQRMEPVDIIIGGPVGSEEWSEDNVIILEYTPSGVVGQPGTGALAGLIDQISEQINNLLKGDDGLAATINSQIKSQLIDQVQDMVDSINEQLTGINGKINGQLNEKIESIKNSLLGKLGRLDRLVDLYNNLANRINKFLSDPNHYLQVLMAYKDGNGSLHHMSTTSKIPSTFVKAGGDALELFVTSYTAELIAPSYAKYVVVTRVLDKNGNKVGGSKDMVNRINGSSEFLNKMLRGDQQRVIIDANELESGYIYEVLYSSLDYRGNSSSRLYYFQVAE